jgi:hypothetical protein
MSVQLLIKNGSIVSPLLTMRGHGQFVTPCA